MKKIADIFLTAFLTVIFTLSLPILGEIIYKTATKGSNNPSKARSYKANKNPKWASSSVLQSISGLVFGAEYSDMDAIRCVVGEAEDQGYEGMLAVAEAIRNRGHLKGVYGCKSDRSLQAPEWVWHEAMDAWKESEFTNLVKGADHWHSLREEKAWWEKYGKLTVIIGDHKFYKEVYR